MRKVTQKIVSAFAQGEPAASGNTTTDGNAIWLHGNRIAQRDESGSVWVTLAGWPTVTTRERVNGLCEELGCNYRITQKNHNQVLTHLKSEETWDIDVHDRVYVSVGPVE
tara:strand:+ start:472 stop:801 length:330 start_codon:yes stop_codon:yes gene_type:complete